MLPKSCAGLLNVVSSPDALGLLVDFYCAGCAASVARPPASAKIDGASANRGTRTAIPLCFDHRVSVAGGRGCCLAGLGPGIGSQGIGFGGPWALADHDCSNCRRCDLGRFAMAQFEADGTIGGKGEGVHACARREDFATIAARAGSLLGFGGDGGRLRGIPVPRLCDGGLDQGGTSGLERGATILCSLWVSAPLPRARWVVKHTGHRHSIRNGANRVRWVGSGSGLAFCGGCSGRSGGAEVPG